MRIRFLYGVFVAVAAAVAFGPATWAGRAPAQPPAAKGDMKGQRAAAFIAAFDAGDAKAVAAFWTPEGDYVDQAGRHHKGRAAIEKLYEKLFAAQKGGKLSVRVTAARMVGTDTAIEDGITEVAPAGGGPATAAAFSAVLVKKDGEWYFESVRDSIAVPPSHAEHFADLEWLLGDWVGEAEKGESATASFDWAANRNFIVSDFAITLNGEPVAGGTQWFGWDPVEKQVRSWSFYVGGGFGEAVWTSAGAKWSGKATAKTPDGKKVTVTNVITKIDNDHYTWQATNLTVDGTAVPDAAAVKMKRVKP